MASTGVDAFGALDRRPGVHEIQAGDGIRNGAMAITDELRDVHGRLAVTRPPST